MKTEFSKLSQSIKLQVDELIRRFDERKKEIQERTEVLSLFRQVQEEQAISTALDYFGPGEHVAFGVDGSMDMEERMETLIFYVNSALFSCPLHVGQDGVRADIRSSRREDALSTHAAVPMWLEDVPEFIAEEQEASEFDVQQTIERIPNSFMTLAELWTAYRGLKRWPGSLALLDRSIAGTFVSSMKDLRIALAPSEPLLTRLEGRYGRPTKLDLSLASVLGPGDMNVPKRFPYLSYLAIKKLMNVKEATLDELSAYLGLADDSLKNRLLKALIRLNEKHENRIFELAFGRKFRINREIEGYWNRVSSAVEEYMKRVFEGEAHPLKISDDAWLTAYEVSGLSVYLLYMIYDAARKGGSLVVGITKDSAASEFTRTVVPLSLSSDKALFKLKNDRTLLTFISAVHYSSLRTPWRTISYDYGLSYVTYLNGEYVATKKGIGRTQLFAKSYFQLRTFRKDPMYRSPVFYYDRFYDERFDSKMELRQKVKIKGREEEISFFIERPDSESNRLDDMIVHLLSRMDNPQVLEALGHNHLLYMADKWVKYEIALIRNSIDGITRLRLDEFARREKLFMASRRFRDLRAESERMREEGAREIER